MIHALIVIVLAAVSWAILSAVGAPTVVGLVAALLVLLAGFGHLGRGSPRL